MIVASVKAGEDEVQFKKQEEERKTIL